MLLDDILAQANFDLTRVETNDLMQDPRYWMLGENQHWFRMQLLEAIPVCVADVSTLRIHSSEHRIRTRMERLFSRENTDDSYMPGKNHQDEKVRKITSGNNGLLVWPAQSGIETMPAKLLEHLEHQNVIFHKLRNGLWLVMNGQRKDVPDIKNAKVNIRELSNQILTTLEKHGKVVGDFQAENATRLCVCVKQTHGLPDMRVIANLNYQKWIEHQVALYRIQRDIAKIVSPEKLHFLMEGVDQSQWQEAVDAIKKTPPSDVGYASAIDFNF